MYEDLQLFFEDPQADRRDWQSAQTCTKGHGRLEVRQITTSCDWQPPTSRATGLMLPKSFASNVGSPRRAKPREARRLWPE